MYGRRRVGLRTRLMLPFVVVFVTALALLGTLFIRSNRAALTESLAKRAELLVKTLATGLADPLSLGEDEAMQQIVDGAKAADADVAYAVVVSAKGVKLGAAPAEEPTVRPAAIAGETTRRPARAMAVASPAPRNGRGWPDEGAEEF